MRGLLVGDIHLSDRPPSLRTEDYVHQIIEKLLFTVKLAEEQKAMFVAWAGDVFHLKAPTRTSHWLVQQVAQIGQSYHVPWLIVPGNHDVQHDRLESLDRQPLGVLFQAGAICLDGEVSVWEDETVFGVPWLKDWRTELPAYMERWRESSAPLMVTHAPIVPPGVDKPYEVIDARDWARLMQPHKGDVYYGHMHDPDGVYEVTNEVLEWQAIFSNEGGLSRGTLHETSLARKPAVTLYDTDRPWAEDQVIPENPFPFQRIEVPHLPAEAVFRLVQKIADEVKEERLDEFLESLGETTLEALSVEKVIADLKEKGVRSEVVDEVESCFEAVAGG